MAQTGAAMSTTTTTNQPGTAQPSALQSLLNATHPSSSDHPPHHIHLTHQIAHNLQHQHLWTSLRIHTHSPTTSLPLPRPLISGLPPTRLYIHPDEQISILQAQKALGKTGLGHVKPEREWVCPSQIREKWSLRRFAEVFEGIGIVPPRGEDGDEEEVVEENRFRTIKRVLLATVDDDSTIVYYIVHDGVVKPRQN